MSDEGHQLNVNLFVLCMCWMLLFIHVLDQHSFPFDYLILSTAISLYSNCSEGYLKMASPFTSM